MAGQSELIYNPYFTATWRTIRPSGNVQFLKATRVDTYPTLAAERDRCVWLRDRGVPVPDVVDYGSDGRVEWLVVSALRGLDATTPEHLDDPIRTVPILARGLRAFHDIDSTDCPFDYRVSVAMKHAAARVKSGAVSVEQFHDIHRQFQPESALARLQDLVVDEDKMVVCHGDYCLPNVMIEQGRVVGYLDLGEVGVADRWRDLAVATWSVTWNLGRGYEDLFLAAYGTEWDLPRRDFYRLLYDLES